RIPVGGLLAYLVQPGELAPFEKETPTSPPAPLSASSEGVTASAVGAQRAAPAITAQPTTRNGDMPTISPRARRVAHELGVDWMGIKGSGRTGRIVERDVRAYAAQQPAAVSAPVSVESPTITTINISPLARRVADELGVDLNKLAAATPGKRIERADVERFASRTVEVAVPSQPAVQGTRSPIPNVRRIIADRMATSAHTTAPVTLTTEVDATELVQLRKQLKAQAGNQIVPAYTDLLAKLIAHALAEHPMLNARFDGSDIVQSEAVHIGLAVDTERGLLVPVVRDVQAKSIRQIAQTSVDLAERARTGKLNPDELQGSTFSITNLGMYDIDAFTPIINLPECAILGVGRIVPKQVVIDAEAERVAIRHMLFLSLTFDHRLVDGAPAARFLQRIKQFIEQPYLWLIN
ncbi:MAG: 2-oxo acid dehydrogenase subunit E2, partial [Anaerolineae bacterium]|nr:2-oxo acid dehydrogenase subunit E2 [Anaerolineae bacterium]